MCMCASAFLIVEVNINKYTINDKTQVNKDNLKKTKEQTKMHIYECII